MLYAPRHYLLPSHGHVQLKILQQHWPAALYALSPALCMFTWTNEVEPGNLSQSVCELGHTHVRTTIDAI